MRGSIIMKKETWYVIVEPQESGSGKTYTGHLWETGQIYFGDVLTCPTISAGLQRDEYYYYKDKKQAKKIADLLSIKSIWFNFIVEEVEINPDRIPQRIPEILEEIKKIWLKYPDLRLGQLILNTDKELAVYNQEDAVLLEKLRKLYQ